MTYYAIRWFTRDCATTLAPRFPPLKIACGGGARASPLLGRLPLRPAPASGCASARGVGAQPPPGRSERERAGTRSARRAPVEDEPSTGAGEDVRRPPPGSYPDRVNMEQAFGRGVPPRLAAGAAAGAAGDASAGRTRFVASRRARSDRSGEHGEPGGPGTIAASGERLDDGLPPSAPSAEDAEDAVVRAASPSARPPEDALAGSPVRAAVAGAHGLTERERAALGPIAPLLDDPLTTDVFVNGAAGAFVDRGSGAEVVDAWPALDERRLRRLAIVAVAAGGRHLDDASPSVDVRLGHGVRVHAVLPPVSVRGTAISVRVPRAAPLGLDDLVRSGSCPAPLARELREWVRRRANILVTGASGSGKTTLLAALLGLADARDRIVLVEDLAELRVDHPHVVQLEARQANIEGAGGIALDRLVREALRMRPDRLVVGEVRGAEVRELLSALNTGHSGGAGTLHANSVGDVAARLEALGALAGLGPEALARQAASAIEGVVHVERRDGARRVASIGVLEIGPDGRLVSRELAAVGAGDSSAEAAPARPGDSPGTPLPREIVDLSRRRARVA